ncbi:hypothetical protein [Reyranella sp.]|uniref:hypothetical protein n=1 Tax=Reyranella sp. TaxID=1929291 RepID=UPI003F71DA99
MLAIVRLVGAFALLLVASAAQAQNKVPSDRVLETLVKASLLTLNDANVTGNYSVLHAKLSKPFRQQFSPEKLKATFREFSQGNADFDIIAAMKPAYDPPPEVDGDGKLVAKGSFPTEPSRLLFELEFIPSDGEWKLIRIHVKLDSKS